MRARKRIYQSDDLIPGQMCIVTQITFDGLVVREGGRRATFKGRDGGHAVVEYEDGTLEKLFDDKRLRG